MANYMSPNWDSYPAALSIHKLSISRLIQPFDTFSYYLDK